MLCHDKSTIIMEYVMVFYYPILLVYYVFCYLSIDRYMVDASSSFA